MNEAQITQVITTSFAHVHAVEAWGDTFFFYNPDRTQPDKLYFATLKSKDDEYDSFSQLDRPAVFRLNIGISKATYRTLFGAQPPRSAAQSAAGDASETAYDYTCIDQLLPHPVYGRMYWVCVLNPSAATVQTVQPLLLEAYELVVSKYDKPIHR